MMIVAKIKKALDVGAAISSTGQIPPARAASHGGHSRAPTLPGLGRASCESVKGFVWSRSSVALGLRAKQVYYIPFGFRS